MNRLQKRAWIELIAVFVMVVFIVIPGLLLLAARNVQGLGYIIICFIVGAPTAVLVFLIEMKKLKKYDEREQAILRKAFSISACVFISYLIAFSYASFFLIGGKESIPVILMPIMVFTGFILAQCTQSFMVLWQCEKDDDE